MSGWPRYPTIYEINTWVWLSELSERLGSSVTLGSVPEAEWNALAAYGFDAVWLMGVWERSPTGIAISNRNKSLLEDFKRALPDFREQDNVGSPYSVRRYTVDLRLGGPDGLASARRELAKRKMRLILDFVPNHVAQDHPWVTAHPEYFIQANTEDANQDPVSFTRIGERVFACGRDPYFPPWQDVLQLNVFQPDLRQAMLETVSSIAEQCDGIRCDMAILVINSIFERTWGSRVGKPPATEYWRNLIPAVKEAHPEFLFIAEAYWDLEWELQQQGFDFCYDKRLYDRLEHGNAENVRLHLSADLDYQAKLLRFIENHDESRAAATFSPEKQRAAAVVIATLPGARLFHEGQFEGRKMKLPVFLGRRPAEPEDQRLQIFYHWLLDAINAPVFREGRWTLCQCVGWPDNASHQNLVAWSWTKDSDRYLIVVNLSDSAAQGFVQVAWDALRGKTWRLADVLSGQSYERNGDQMLDPGLYVDLKPWNCHFFRMLPL
ncbi:MAG TPA: alpha-amylase family glycosyl hydrolase [Candidatus Binatia bacterium]|nr:alpha-amylase family glycosyl hydrolase [Candidatus Binatia bacterium]